MISLVPYLVCSYCGTQIPGEGQVCANCGWYVGDVRPQDQLIPLERQECVSPPGNQVMRGAARSLDLPSLMMCPMIAFFAALFIDDIVIIPILLSYSPQNAPLFPFLGMILFPIVLAFLVVVMKYGDSRRVAFFCLTFSLFTILGLTLAFVALKTLVLATASSANVDIIRFNTTKRALRYWIMTSMTPFFLLLVWTQPEMYFVALILVLSGIITFYMGHPIDGK